MNDAIDRVGNHLQQGDLVLVTPASQTGLIGKVVQITEGGLIAKATPDLKQGMMMPGKIYVVLEFIYDPRAAILEMCKIATPPEQAKTVS